MDGTGKEESWEGVASAANESEAALIAGFLESRGIPARVVEARAAEGIAGRMAFDAYAVSADIDDPLNKVLLTLGSRTEDIDESLAEILRRLGELEAGDGSPRSAAGGRS